MNEKHSNQQSENTREFLKNLSSQDFLNFGLQEVAYIRRVEVDNKTAYAIHAADGTPLSVMDSESFAMITARHNDLEPVQVH